MKCIYEDYECSRVFNEIVLNVENSKFVGIHRIGFVDEQNEKHILIEFPIISQEKLDDLLKCFGNITKMSKNLNCNTKTISDSMNQTENIDNGENALNLVSIYNVGKSGKHIKISLKCLEEIKKCLSNMELKLGPRMKFTDYNKLFELRCLKNLPIKKIYEQLGIGNKTYAKRYNEIMDVLEKSNIKFE